MQNQSIGNGRQIRA